MAKNTVPLPGTVDYCGAVQEKIHGRISYYVKAFASALFFIMCTVGGVYMFVWASSTGQDLKIDKNENAIISTQKDIEYMTKGIDEQRGMMREQANTQLDILKEIRKLEK